MQNKTLKAQSQADTFAARNPAVVVPGGQKSQEVARGEFVYVPMGQAVHGP